MQKCSFDQKYVMSHVIRGTNFWDTLYCWITDYKTKSDANSYRQDSDAFLHIAESNSSLGRVWIDSDDDLYSTRTKFQGKEMCLSV